MKRTATDTRFSSERRYGCAFATQPLEAAPFAMNFSTIKANTLSGILDTTGFDVSNSSITKLIQGEQFLEGFRDTSYLFEWKTVAGKLSSLRSPVFYGVLSNFSASNSKTPQCYDK